jgi:16S rRNA (guanine527-N7)-methyltransferase
MTIEKHFKLNEIQTKQFQDLQVVFKEWNDKINLISRKDMDNFLDRHVLHSLSIGLFIQFKKDAYVMDLGTGGGLPGIPLAILFPETQFLLVDSINKKLIAINDICERLGIKNVKTMHVRAESIKEKFDYVVTRAVAPMPDLIRWTRGKFKDKGVHAMPNGIIALKGGDLKKELSGLKVEKFPLKKIFKDDFFEEKYIIYYPVY